MKDLIRYLRHDDENHEIRRFLGEAKVLVTDLLPLIKHYNEDEDLFDVTLRQVHCTLLSEILVTINICL